MTRHARTLRRATTTALACTLSLTALTLTGSSSSAAPPQAGKKPTYTVQDPDFTWDDNCTVKDEPFTPTAGAGGTTTTYTGVRGGASYQLEVPADWNGDLVLWAHGYNGEGTHLCVEPPPLREHYVDQGFAWAASSYATNGYDVAQGVKDTHGLLGVFRGTVGQPEDVYLTGASMGGHITAVAIEQYPKAFDAAMPVCGVLGDVELFDYFLDANVTAAALADLADPATSLPKPPFPAEPEQYVDYVNDLVAPELTTLPYAGPPLIPNAPLGQAWGGAVQQSSGGTRPGFTGSFLYWNLFGFGDVPQVPFLFGVYPGLTAGTIGQEVGNVVSNTGTVYEIDGAPGQSTLEQALNASVLRIDADPQTRRGGGLAGIPRISGDISIPVMSLHTLGDLFVPFSMEQVYAQRVAANGASDLLTQRAIRATGHCEFAPAELVEGFDALVAQVRDGVQPAGDDVLTPSVVAAPNYGCEFTRVTRQYPFLAPLGQATPFAPCPTT